MPIIGNLYKVRSDVLYCFVYATNVLSEGQIVLKRDELLVLLEYNKYITTLYWPRQNQKIWCVPAECFDLYLTEMTDQ